MLNVPASQKPLIDLTEETERDRMEDLECEVERLNEVVTTLVLRRKAA